MNTLSMSILVFPLGHISIFSKDNYRPMITMYYLPYLPAFLFSLFSFIASVSLVYFSCYMQNKHRDLAFNNIEFYINTPVFYT